MDNRTIARQLLARARYLDAQHASLYKVRAFRRAAETLLGLDVPAESIVAERGRHGLEELPGIGAHLSRVIETLVHTGALPTLNSDPRKPQGERSEPWGSGERECQACAVSSK